MSLTIENLCRVGETKKTNYPIECDNYTLYIDGIMFRYSISSGVFVSF